MKTLMQILERVMMGEKLSMNDFLEAMRATIVLDYWNNFLSDRPEDHIEQYRRTLPNLRRLVGKEPTVQTLKNILNRNGIDTSNLKDEE